MTTADQLAAFAYWLGRQPGILGRLLKDLDRDTLTRLAREHLGEGAPAPAPLTPADVLDIYQSLNCEFSPYEEQCRVEAIIFRLCDLHGWDVATTLDINPQYVRSVREHFAKMAASPPPIAPAPEANDDEDEPPETP
jgi:hypothetical protein